MNVQDGDNVLCFICILFLAWQAWLC